MHSVIPSVIPGIVSGLFKRLTGRRTVGSRRASNSRPSRSQRGFVLVEALVALAIMGSATAATLASLSTGTLLTSRTALRGTADWLATSQANLVHEASFQATPGTYANVTTPTDFVIANTTSAIIGGDDQIQAVTITVTYQGLVLLTMEVLKADR